MSKTRVPAIPAPTDSNLREVARAVKGVLDVREGLLGDPLDAAVTFRDLADGGIINVTTINRGGGTSGIVVAPPSLESDGYDPASDLTPPPAPTGLTANGALTTVILGWTAASYANHAYTEIWRSTTDVIGNAVRIGTTIAALYNDAVGSTNTLYYYWIRFVSKADVVGPYNATNGVSGGTGRIGNVDLNPLIIEAGNLASGAVTGTKLAANAIDLTKFANGIEPITVVTGNLPTTKSTNSIFRTDDGKLYRWNGTAYVASVPAVDVTGQLTNSQLQDIAAAKITGTLVASQIADASLTTAKFASGIEPITVVAGSTVPTTKSTNTIFLAGTGKLYRWTGTAYIATVPTADLDGTIANAQIAGVAASKVTGQLTNAQIADVAAAKLTGEIVSSQIANAAVTTAKFASGIEPLTVVTGTLPTTKSTNAIFRTDDQKVYRWNGSAYVASVATSDLSGTIADAQLAGIAASKITGQLTDAQIQAVAAAKVSGQLTNAQLADIAATKITGQLTNAQIADVAAAKLTGTITETQISNDAISSPKIAAGAITTAKLAVGAVTANTIAADAVTSAKIITGAITTAKIAAGAITAGEIAAGAVTTTKLSAGAVTANELAAGSVVADKIAANAVTAAKIETGAVTTAKLAAGAVTANEIAAGTITGGKIAAGTITGSNIAADTITAGQIAAGAIGASEIAAGAVTAEKLTVASFGDSVILNPGFEEASSSDATLPSHWTRARVWGGNSSTVYRATTGAVRSGSASLELIPGAGSSADAFADSVPVAEGEQWYLSCRAISSGTNAGTSPGFYFRVRGGSSVEDLGQELYIAVENAAVPTSWTKYEGVVTIPAGMRWARPFVLNYLTNTGAKVTVDDVEFKKVVVSATIADGAVTAAKVQAGAITTAKLDASAVTADKIAANAVTAEKIEAGSVVAAKIAAGAIDATKIAASTITGDKIAANTITGSNIAADTITAGQIAAGAVGASEVAAGAIRANHILVAPKGLNPDPMFEAGSSFWGGFVEQRASSDAVVPAGCPGRLATKFNQRDNMGPWIDVNPGEVYKASIWVNREGASAQAGWVSYSLNGLGQDQSIYPAGATTLTGWRQVVSTFTVSANVRRMRFGVWIDYGGGGSQYIWATDFQVEKVNDASLIVDGAIVANKIAAGAIITEKLAASAITADTIAANAITTPKIATDAITSDKIAANAVTADEIAANAITAGKIAAGAVSATQIAAGAITTDKLLVTGRGDAINDDPNTQDVGAWTGSGISIATDTSSPVGDKVLRCPNNAAVLSRAAPIDPNKNYQLRLWIRQQAGSSTTYLTVAFADASGNNLSGGTASGWPSGGTFFYFGLVNAQPSGSWTEYRISFGPGETAKIPSAARTVRVGLLANYTGSGTQDVAGIRLMLKADADLIVDGAIVANKLAANAIAVGSAAIQNGAIVNAMIGNLAVDSANIADGAITTAKIGDAQITTAKIGDAQITDAKIANLNAGKITAGTISADRIGAGSITANKINGANLKITAGGVDVGFDVGPSAGHYGISLSSSDFNNIFLRRNDGVVFFRINDGGDQSLTFNSSEGQLRIRGQINGGAYNGYSWPANGGTGFHLGPSGLLLGNANAGPYLELQSNGNLYAPGFTIVGGSATFSGTISANVVKTNSIEGAAVTTGYSAATAGDYVAVTVVVPSGASALMVIAYAGDPYQTAYGSGKDTYFGTALPTGYLSVNSVQQTVQQGALVWSTGSPAAGTYTVAVWRNAVSGTMTLGVLVTKR